MNHRMFFTLMAIPTIVGSLLTMVLFSSKANALEKTNITNQLSCDVSPTPSFKSSMLHQRGQGVLIASSVTGGDVPVLDFSEAESDAAITLFGCDCSSCMRGLRQLRSQPVVDLNKVNGHCWTSLKERVSPQQLQTVLQELNMQEGN